MTTALVELQKRHQDIVALKPPVDPATLVHKAMLDAPSFRRIPAYADVSDEQFLDNRWQAKK